MATHFYLMEAIIYHRVDWDGYTSAAVALKAFPNASLFGWTYGDPVPNVSSFDKVILVDLSLPEDWMLTNASKLIWIDHHKNTIETLQQNKVLWSVPGVRRDGIGACALAWEYFFPGVQMPAHVSAAACADVMNRSKGLTNLKIAITYSLYLDTFGPGFVRPVGDVSRYHIVQALRLLDDMEAAEGFVKANELETKRFEHETKLFENAIECKIDGFNACVLHIDGRPNACIMSHLLKNTHDVFVCIVDKVEDKYKISLRVPYESKFDASEFCRRFGGNGHIKAAGCLMSEEEIQSLL